jgi:1-acyl-sn-glycerol-3-phosphate acyltransferase
MKRSMLWKTLQVPCRILTSVLFDLKVYDKHYLPKEGGVLLLANHQSLLDMIVIGSQLDRPISFLARSGLFKNPVLRWLITSLHAFPVRQGEADVGAIRESIRRLKEGHILNIYPEGSRTLTGELGPIEPGAALIVRRAGVSILPVVVDGAFDAWPRGRQTFRTSPIRVMFGPPMDVSGRSAGEIVKLIEVTLREMLEALRRRDPYLRRKRAQMIRRHGASDQGEAAHTVETPVPQ